MGVKLYYEDFEIGMTYPIFEYAISAEDMELHRASYDYTLEGMEDTAPSASEKVISPFAINSFLAMRSVIAMPDGVLHARETLHLHSPAYVADRLHVELSVLDKYERNGRPFLVFRHRVTRDKGDPVMDIDRTVCWLRKGNQ